MPCARVVPAPQILRLVARLFDTLRENTYDTPCDNDGLAVSEAAAFFAWPSHARVALHI